MNGIRLVTRADDAGMSPVANRAIRDTVTHGIVRNISLMAPAPAIRDAYAVLGELADRVNFGLHVTLNAEWENVRWRPLTSSPKSGSGSFVRRDGTMHFRVPDLRDANPDAGLMMDEVRAQYELLTNLGFRIDYVDEHMGVGSVAGLGERLVEFAHEHNLVSNRELFENGTIDRLPGWESPGEHPGTELADHLAGVAAGTYLLVGHPVTKDEEMQRFRLPGQAAGEEAINRNRQRRMFMDIEIVDYCQEVEIELLRYTQV